MVIHSLISDKEALLALGLVTSAKKLLHMPISDVKLTLSFVGIPLVDLSVSWTNNDTSLKKMMEPFGDMMKMGVRLGLGDSD